MLWVPSRPVRSRSKPPGFILPCQPALADGTPSGPGSLHAIKWAGYRVIVRKDSEQVRLWARTTSDYSKALTRIRDAIAALRSIAPCSMARRLFCAPTTHSMPSAEHGAIDRQRRDRVPDRVKAFE